MQRTSTQSSKIVRKFSLQPWRIVIRYIPCSFAFSWWESEHHGLSILLDNDNSFIDTVRYHSLERHLVVLVNTHTSPPSALGLHLMSAAPLTSAANFPLGLKWHYCRKNFVKSHRDLHATKCSIIWNVPGPVLLAALSASETGTNACWKKTTALHCKQRMTQ